MAKNLFDKVKKAEKPSAKKNDKLNVVIKDEEFDKNLIKMAELTAQIDVLTAELAVAQGYVKDFGIETFNDVYQKSGGYPGSFILSTPSQASVMIVPMDKYLKCDEDRFEELKKTYGDDVVTEKTEFIINSELLEKYGDVLSDLIEGSDLIDEEDKVKLFQAKTTYSVSKGSIEKAFTWGKGKVADFVRDIQPIFALKNAKYK